jgi:acetyltransferase
VSNEPPRPPSPAAPAAKASPTSRDDAPFDGSPTWRVERTLKDGTPFTIRPLTPDDREELRRGFHQVSAKTRYLRFLGAMGELSDAMLTYLTEVDQKNHIALVATMTSPDLKTEHGIGVARVIRLAGTGDVAEAAITVVDDMQHRGVGSWLAHELECAARLAGIRTIRAEVLADNAPMRGILEGAGARPLAESASKETVSYDIALGPASAKASRVMEILRGVAQTMAASIRLLTPP